MTAKMKAKEKAEKSKRRRTETSKNTTLRGGMGAKRKRGMFARET